MSFNYLFNNYKPFITNGSTPVNVREESSGGLEAFDQSH